MSSVCRCCGGTGKQPDWRVLGRKVRAARERKGLGLRELARIVGCSAGFVTDIEYGRRGGGLSGAKTQRLLAVLEINP
jgi:transcriptional regulator with XRE-family HTH domain